MTEFLRVTPMSVQDLLEEWFESEPLRACLAVDALLGRLPVGAGHHEAARDLVVLDLALHRHSRPLEARHLRLEAGSRCVQVFSVERLASGVEGGDLALHVGGALGVAELA